MKNRILSFLFALILMNSLAITAFASHPVPDLSQDGSVTFIMEWDGQLLNGGQLNLYKVGDIAVEDGDYSFCLIDELQDCDVTLDNVSDPLLAEALLSNAKTAQLQPFTAQIEKGKAVRALPVGLYVVWQNDQDATKGYAPIQPFLISVPRFEDNAYELNPVAYPKVPLETAPPETTPSSTPTTPPDERLPQTGQLNWPIPVMALSGIGLFIAGWILCASKKRAEDEK